MTKPRTLGIIAALLLLVAGVSLSAQAETFKGEIMDSACAAAGSHAAMQKAHPEFTAKDCTLGCIKMGATFVLYDASTKTVYKLSDQKKPEGFAGAKVEVSGTLDKATKTIKVTDIKVGS
jgi:hypothetical protein